MKKNKLKLPRETRRAMMFLGLVALVLLGLSYFLRPQLERRETVNVYFIKDGQVLPVTRKTKTPPLTKAINDLVNGPTEEEKKAGYITGIPADCRALSIRGKGKAAEITFNQKLENYSGSAGSVKTMLAQIVYTATDIPGINTVLIKIAGRQEVVLGGEGLVVSGPLSRADLRR